jgi:hypothetical protein
MKKNLFVCSLFTIILLLPAILFSQNAPVARWPQAPTGQYRCYTDEVDKWRMQQNGTAGNHALFETWISSQLQQVQDQQAQNRNIPIIYNIPVIFHIVHNGEAAGTGTNIAALYINAQIQQLNNDFRKIAGTSGYNTHASGADVQIKFTAATLSPANATLGEPGINRINRNAQGWTAPPFLDTYIDGTIKPNSIWDATKYLNIWVCDVTTAGGAVLGYAQFPDAPNELGIGINNSANTDGVVVYYTSVGSSLQKQPGANPYDEGRTATHEVGHWLGLRHIWGDGDCTVDDFIFDTPRSSGPNFGCTATTNSCNDSTYGFLSNPNDMVQNYMDYTDDACMNIFTVGQRNRMRVVMGETLEGAPRRAILRFSDRCQAGPLVSLIKTDTTVIEKTDCNINWGYTIPVRISGAPNANTTVTLTQTSGNFDGQDITISPADITFTSTDYTDKNFTIMVKADAAMEGHEIGFLNLNVSGSNATAATDSFELIIMNDDHPPMMGKRMPVTLLTEDFEGTITGWNTHEYEAGNNKWLLGGTNGNMNGSKSTYISKNASSLSYDETSTARTILFHEVDANNTDSLALSFYYVCEGEKFAGFNYDYGKIVYSLDSITFHQLNGTADLVETTNMTNFSIQLPYFLWNRKFYIGLYWENDNITGTDPSFAIDDVTITGKRNLISMIETSLNSTGGYDEKPLGPLETVYFYDRSTGDIMAKIQNMGGFNYGCVKVEIDRAGNNAQWITGDPQTVQQTKIFDKTYKITPTNNNANGQYNITFYITNNEAMGWMLNSTNPLPNAKMIKYNGAISSMTYTSTFEQNLITSTNYMAGTDWEFASTFNTGFSGFGFGIIPPVTLPVNLLSFTAVERNKTVLLKWKVENEINTDHYTVMRSSNAINFSAIGTAPARGISNGIGEYNLIDPQPLIGKNYYQLVSYDGDGRFKKSQIVEVTIRSLFVYEVNPNPFTDRIAIKTNNNSSEILYMVLTDATGRQILTRNITGNTNGMISLPVPAIAPGIYFLKIADGKNTTVLKVIKQ